MAEQPSRRRILFVDDEESIRLTLPRILAKNGFEVTSLARLADALAEIRAQRYDVLLSDLNLPDIDGGFALIEEMRKNQPHCVNFILTGYPAEESLERAKVHEVAHYFTKPVEIEDLVQTIKEKLYARDSRPD
jgi:two-component system response regulator (stage 0 sporulation protein F)